MHYLGLALVAEGPTDYRFLPPVLRQAAEDACRIHCRHAVEIGDVTPLPRQASFRDVDRSTQITEAVRKANGAFHILFLHTDGAGDSSAARRERVAPIAARLDEIRDSLGRLSSVAVIPVRETEAWALADGDALRGAFGTRLSDDDLGLPSNPRDVERIRDPKRTLEEAYARVTGKKRRSRGASAFLETIWERVKIERLKLIPAYAEFERELITALRTLGYIRDA
jgi:hypothetical protein